MKEISLRSLNTIAEECVSAAQRIAQSFRSNWDDQVHDSFSRYVNFAEELSESVRSINEKAEAVKSEMLNVRTDELIQDTERLCDEADSI